MLGTNAFTAIVTFAGDTNMANDTATAENITTGDVTIFPTTDSVEGNGVSLFNATYNLSGNRDLWRFGNGYYTNADMADTLFAHSGSGFYLFDAYSGASSAGIRDILLSDCLPGVVNASYSVKFFISHDTLFSNGPNASFDSIYVTVSADKGISWNRIAGFARVNPAFATPGWQQETVFLNAYMGQTIQVGWRV